MTDEEKADLAVLAEDQDPLVNDLRVLEDARNLVVRLWALEEETQEADAQELAREAIAMVERLSKLADPRAVNERIFEALMAKCVELQWQNEQFQRVIEEDGEMIADMATAEEAVSSRLTDTAATVNPDILRLVLALQSVRDGEHGHIPQSVRDFINATFDADPFATAAGEGGPEITALDFWRQEAEEQNASRCQMLDTIASLRAALSTSVPAGVVGIKPLEWRKGYRDEQVTIDQASFGGLYQVRDLGDEIALDLPGRRSITCLSVEAAKAAAQADYEAHVRAAITPPAQEPTR